GEIEPSTSPSGRVAAEDQSFPRLDTVIEEVDDLLEREAGPAAGRRGGKGKALLAGNRLRKLARGEDFPVRLAQTVKCRVSAPLHFGHSLCVAHGEVVVGHDAKAK